MSPGPVPVPATAPGPGDVIEVLACDVRPGDVIVSGTRGFEWTAAFVAHVAAAVELRSSDGGRFMKVPLEAPMKVRRTDRGRR